MPRRQPLDLPPQPRPRALADLEAKITAAEALQQKCADQVAQLIAAGRPVRREESMLRMLIRKVAQLRESRVVLAAGDLGTSQE